MARAASTATDRRIGHRELTRLLGDWADGPGPGYAALAGRVRMLVLDGRLPVGVRVPPERALAGQLGVSRTTVGSAYDVLRDAGYARSRQGSGTWTALPSTDAEVPSWAPGPPEPGVIDFIHAAPAAPPQLHTAYLAALEDLPRHLPGTGYDYRGLASLRRALAERFTVRGLPTTPEQILVTNGALQAVRLALNLVLRPGDRVVVEQPGYPNGLDVVADLGGRAVPVPVDPGEGRWDLDALTAAVRQTAPRAAYLIPDYQNPTGAVMPDEDRRRAAQALHRAGALTIVDETLVELALDGSPPAVPFAAAAGRAATVTVGSASKIFWGGLRIGWLRSDVATVTRLAALRARQDLAGPVLEQLACLHLLHELDTVRVHRTAELRVARDHLVGLIGARLPDWRVLPPPGGQVLWCGLPTPSSTRLSLAAAGRGLRVPPGPRFAADATLESWVRLPFTRPLEELDAGVALLGAAWDSLSQPAGRGRAPSRVRPLDLDRYLV